ncbi:TrbI/VirB10 family protein [Rhodobacter maris]|uniref:Type IV secretion system protein VirB10 n=1 Tax=Rhodobacter maris TaxID=446682 RepID=A0A285TDQ8_9RHOB|nr:TrbI/VirB10 family protein [Rhodobacter maris]SOC20374.1 type IV secretion system protein VirB10 [Rhodobacter maris]
MTDLPESEKLAERLARMQPQDPKPKRRGVNPYALSAVTAVTGLGAGVWLALSAPEAPEPAPPIATASVSDFQQDGIGTDGFTISRPKPDLTIKPDRSAEERLKLEIVDLQAQIATLKANAVTVPDEAKLQELGAKIAKLEEDARNEAAARAELERDNIRLQTELDTAKLVQGDSEAEARRAREEELARRRQEANALSAAQINSDMVALRNESAGGSGGDVGASGATGADAFRRAGAKTSAITQAEVIANPAHTIVQGTVIEAALETAINTDLAGNVSAIVSRDVWSFDMTRVLVPRGSKLFGRYDSDVSPGQRRVLIAWDRLITTDGQTVVMAAFGTDRVGRSGLPGRVRTHFLERFGSAALISVIGAVPALAAAKYASNEITSDTAKDVGTDLGNAVGDAMADYLNIPSTISVDQGAVVMVRVDTDLEFF